jgi:hypothetical protein
LQQAACALQQAPPLQQPALAGRDGAALAVLISANTAAIINRYFIKYPSVEFPSSLARNLDKPTPLNNRGSRRRDGRALGAAILAHGS